MLLVSPAEPPALRKLGTVSATPETVGADFLFPTQHGLVGVQRKEVRDLVASVHGDRIARELGQSTDLYRMVLLVEGDWEWQPSGDSRVCPGFSRAQYDGLMLSFQEIGWYVMTSVDLADTMQVLGRIQRWFEKADHTSLRQRPKSRAPWGSHLNREWGMFWWQSFDGIGVGMAGVLYDHVGVPACWTVSEAELLAIAGVGKRRAKKILDALDRGEKVGDERKVV